MVCTDIRSTYINALSDKLNLANAFLKNLIQSSTVAVIAADPNEKIQLFNEADRKLYGYSLEEALVNLEITAFFPEKSG
jgi:PAS domain S-box-containing protein